MRQKALEKLAAIKMRKQGKSVPEIATKLNVAKSSVSVWVRNVPLSPTAEKRLLKKISTGQLAGGKSRHNAVIIREATYLQLALDEIKKTTFTKQHHLNYCALIYWCEGAKSANCVDFTNSDPQLVDLFLRLFRSCFALTESKLRVSLHVHDYHDTNTQINFWSEVTRVPKQQFIKPYQKPHTGKQIRDNYQGCVSIRYHDSEIARQLMAQAKAMFVSPHLDLCFH